MQPELDNNRGRTSNKVKALVSDHADGSLTIEIFIRQDDDGILDSIIADWTYLDDSTYALPLSR